MPRNSRRAIGNHAGSLFPEMAQASEAQESNPRRGESSVRQEVLNVLMAQLLKERGVVAAPEQIVKDPFGARRMPDIVVVNYEGLRLVIEGEFASRTAKDKASRAALKRVEDGIAHLAMALIYPDSLRHLGSNITHLRNSLEESELEFAVITESEALQSQLALPEVPEKQKELVSFSRGRLRALADTLRRAYEQLLQDRVLERAVQSLTQGLGQFSLSLTIQPATTWRFAEALEIRGLSKKKASADESESQKRRMDPVQAEAVNRIAGLILVNAMMFQQVLAQSDGRVQKLEKFQQEEDFIGSLADHWKFILEEINYFPIFHVARDVLCCVMSDVDAVRALRGISMRAQEIVGWRAPLRHDLAGRIYHLLLTEAKYLGAYYTSIPAAVLLAKIALRPQDWNYDWGNLSEIGKFHFADLACGTGTLLMAASDVVVDNYVHESAQQGKRLQLPRLQQVIVEKTLYGFDVLHSATHLTASTLALRVPDVPINVTHLSTLPLGGPENKLGSLEFSQGETIQASTLFSQTARQVLGKEARPRYWITIPLLDLCIMNPPFTRSVGGNLLFGNLPEPDREAMQRKLKNLVSGQNLAASITAGLGSVFIALADKYLKPDGRLALVLPRALLSGVAWQKTRGLINKDYHLEWVIVSHEPNHWNFSDNTDLSEVLVIVRKGDKKGTDSRERVTCVNLWKQPRNSVEALTLARQLTENSSPDLHKGQGALEILRGNEKVGEAVSIPWSSLRKGLWNFPCAFAQADLARSLLHLLEGKLYLPARGIVRGKQKLNLRPLRELCELGFDVRDMHDGFKLATYKTAYPAFWDHDASRVFTLKRNSNRFLSPLPEAKPGRPLREATHLWEKAGCLLIAERLRLNTMRLTAVRVEEKVLSNVWWTLALKKGGVEAEKALALWLNSTLGILLYWGHREETQGPWVKFKKPVLGQMPVLDVSGISARATRQLAQAFDQLAERALLPFPEMADDPVRAEIDEAVASALGLPDFSILRQLLAREPILCLSLDRLQVTESG